MCALPHGLWSGNSLRLVQGLGPWNCQSESTTTALTGYRKVTGPESLARVFSMRTAVLPAPQGLGCREAQGARRAWHCVTGAGPTHPQDWASFYSWYLPTSPLYTGICFQRIPRVGSLVGSGSQLVVNYNPIRCHRSLTSNKQVF